MPDLGRRRVLLVDDDAAVLEILRVALEGQGHQVLTAGDGCEALSRAERDAPDLVILDVMIPRRNGLVVLKRIQSWIARRPRVIMVSGDDDPRHRAFAEAHGAAAFLQKPFEVDVLLQEVERVLGTAPAFAARFVTPDVVPSAN